MVKVLKTSQGKVLTLNGDVLTTNAIVPTGTLNITENDTYDVTNYASAVVNVSGGGDIIEAINNTGAAISADDKVFIAPLTTPQSGADYEIVKPKIATNPLFGFWRVGDVVIDFTNKEASSFGSYKYLEVPQVMDYTHPWEFNICFVTGSNATNKQDIYWSNDSDFSSAGLTVRILDGKIEIRLSDKVGNIAIGVFNSYSVAANTTYYVRIGWTGTEYYVRYSVNGTDWTSETPITSNVQVSQTSTGICIGYRPSESSYYFKGKIYMDKTYLTSGDTIQWQMYSDDASNLGSDILTGIANESIASGSVGEVTTLLGD